MNRRDFFAPPHNQYFPDSVMSFADTSVASPLSRHCRCPQQVSATKEGKRTNLTNGSSIQEERTSVHKCMNDPSIVMMANQDGQSYNNHAIHVLIDLEVGQPTQVYQTPQDLSIHHVEIM